MKYQTGDYVNHRGNPIRVGSIQDVRIGSGVIRGSDGKFLRFGEPRTERKVICSRDGMEPYMFDESELDKLDPWRGPLPWEAATSAPTQACS